MMRLPSKELIASPFLLTEDRERQKKDVARLEFKSANYREEPEVVAESTSEETGSYPEVEALKEQLRSESAQFHVRLEETERRVGEEVRAQCSDEFSSNLAAERERITNLCRRFERERRQYFEKVEYEVAKLSLAIAERVLH